MNERLEKIEKGLEKRQNYYMNLTESKLIEVYRVADNICYEQYPEYKKCNDIFDLDNTVDLKTCKNAIKLYK